MAYLSNVGHLFDPGQIKIDWDMNQPIIDTSTYDLTTNRGGYNSNDRQGSISTKADNSTLDTSEYDAKINDYWKAYQDYTKEGNKLIQLGTSKSKNWDPDKYERQQQAYAAARDALNKWSDATLNKNKYLEAQANKLNLDESTTAADQALASQQQSDTATAQANRTANINAGINKSAAGLLGSQAATSNSNVASALYGANRSGQASTQADYLNKLNMASGQDANARAAQLQAKNMNENALLSALGGGMMGMGSGAAMGATMSDEKTKEPISDEEMAKAYKEFTELYFRLKALKEGK